MLGDFKGVDLSLKPGAPFDHIPRLLKDSHIDEGFWLHRQRHPVPPQHEPSFLHDPVPEPTQEQLAWAARFPRSSQDEAKQARLDAQNRAVLNSIAKELPRLNNAAAIRQYLAGLPGASRQH